MLKTQAYAFVLPRYFEGLAGGAETLSSKLAKKLSEHGHTVELFATCAKDNRTWENHFKPGSEKEGGLTVHRFPVDERDLNSWIPKQISISQGMRLNLDDQLEWLKQGVNSQAMYQEIFNRQNEFDYIFFAPYLFASTFWGSLMVSDKAVLIPCLHDEPYAYLEAIASMFRMVKGALFNARAEMELAARLYGEIKGNEVGMGFEPFPESYINSLKHNQKISGPYILYQGRKETGKNVHLLIDYFIEAKERYGLPRDIQLVIAGGGSFSDLHRASTLERGDIIDIDHVPESEKHALMKDALLFVQPSVNESFSIVIMESWLLGVPCLVHSECAVTAGHVIDSGGGLCFGSAAEFSETVKTIKNDKLLRVRLAECGRSYVEARYSWEAVISRFYDAISTL